MGEPIYDAEFVLRPMAGGVVGVIAPGMGHAAAHMVGFLDGDFVKEHPFSCDITVHGTVTDHLEPGGKPFQHVSYEMSIDLEQMHATEQAQGLDIENKLWKAELSLMSNITLVDTILAYKDQKALDYFPDGWQRPFPVGDFARAALESNYYLADETRAWMVNDFFYITQMEQDAKKEGPLALTERDLDFAKELNDFLEQ